MWGNNPPLGKTQQSQQREKLNSQKLQIIHLSDRSGIISVFRMTDMKEIISTFQNNVYERERGRDHFSYWYEKIPIAALLKIIFTIICIDI